MRSELPLRRRALFGALAAVAGAHPLAALAQSAARTYRIVLLETVPAAQNAANLAALRNALRALGYVEGRNLVIDYRSSDGHADRFPALAADAVRTHPDVIVARGTPATQAALQATATLPVIMAAMGDAGGRIASFARPDTNVTGFTTFSTELTAKRVEILAELVPGLRRIALLHNLGNPAAGAEWEETQRAARNLGLQPTVLDVRAANDLAPAFARAGGDGVGAMLVGADGLLQWQARAVVELAAARRLPAAYPARDFVEAGGLVAYGIDYPDLYARIARYVDRIVKGARPGELPIEQPTTFELVLNARTARTLGLAVPESLRLRAEIIA